MCPVGPIGVHASPDVGVTPPNAPVITDSADGGDNESVIISVTGVNTIRLFYQVKYGSEWIVGETRSGSGDIVQTGLSAGIYYAFYCVDDDGTLVSAPSNVVTQRVSSATTDIFGDANQCIRHYVSQVTGLNINTKVLKQNQDAPTPDDLFSTILISPVDNDGHDSIIYSDDDEIDLVESRTGNRNFMASINFYGANALNNAYKIQGSAYESANLDFLTAKGIGFISTSPVRDLTEIDLARYEERGQIDFFFYVIDDNENVVSSVQQADIEANFDEYSNVIEVRP